uniref:BZIP domain-containing protein n=1 Tax=Mola mola TaxID=94237 RepID=A0A3Q3W2L5_MOLML
MSRPAQPTLNTADHNGVSVIQSQAAASSSLPDCVTGLQQVPQLVPANPTAGGGKALPPSKMKKPQADKDSEEYRQRRERNNLAVKKSRMRSKQKAMDTQQRVNELKEENEGGLISVIEGVLFECNHKNVSPSPSLAQLGGNQHKPADLIQLEPIRGDLL